ncbi:LuxR C-terminal-related transcriptional regulator, partial [Streptomyces sp. 12257]
LRAAADDPACRLELALAAAQSGHPELAAPPAGPDADRSPEPSTGSDDDGPAVNPTGSTAPQSVESRGRSSDSRSAGPLQSSAAVVGSDSLQPSAAVTDAATFQPPAALVESRTPRPTATPTGSSGTSGAADSREAAAGSAVTTWWAAARGDLDAALGTVGEDPYDAVRLGAPERAVGRLTGVFAAHAEALAQDDGPALDRAAQALEERGFLLFAAEAYAQAARSHRDPGAARTSRTRAVALARRCQGARTPALSGLVLGELTARQRQIVTLAAAGLSNRQIAEKLTLSIRTVGNHLYSAYVRLGASDRDALPCLVELPEAQPA